MHMIFTTGGFLEAAIEGWPVLDIYVYIYEELTKDVMFSCHISPITSKHR